MILLNNIEGISRVFDYMLFFMPILIYTIYANVERINPYKWGAFTLVLLAFNIFSMRTMLLV